MSSSWQALVAAFWSLARILLGFGLPLAALVALGAWLGFRKPISWRWRLGLGVASFVLIAATYTYFSWTRQREDPNDMLLPNWYQLWTKGVLQNLTPVATGLRPPSPQEREKEEARAERVKTADRRLREHMIKEDDERLKEEVERLRALAGPVKEDQIQAEADRLSALPALPLDQHDQAEDDLKAALAKLSDSERPKVTEGLKKIEDYAAKDQEATKKAEASRVIWRFILWEDIKATVFRLFFGLGITMLVSVLLGILMGSYPAVEGFLYPPFAILAKIPGTAMMSLFFAVSAANEFWFCQYMILFGMIPTLTQTMYYYTKDVPEELLFKARTLGASQAECIWSVIFRQILPKIMESLRLAVGPALIFLFAAEYTFGDWGLGCRMRLVIHKSINDMPTVYFYIVCIALLFFAIENSLRWLERKVFPWYYPE
jgi:NitT/TauT family transport system permease protein